MEKTLITTLIAQWGITVVVAAAIGYGVFQFLGKKWLDLHFAERLESFRHSQNQEIERLRFRINALMDRTSKLHQNEFEVLPDVWDKLTIALSRTKDFTSRIVRYPDVGRMNEDELTEFLVNSPLSSFDRASVMAAQNRDASYRDIIFWYRLHDVKTTHADFHNYFISKGIFIQAELKEKIRALSNMMYDAFAERESDKANPVLGEGRFAKSDLLQRDGEKAMREIENEIQARLWDANKID